MEYFLADIMWQNNIESAFLIFSRSTTWEDKSCRFFSVSDSLDTMCDLGKVVLAWNLQRNQGRNLGGGGAFVISIIYVYVKGSCKIECFQFFNQINLITFWPICQHYMLLITICCIVAWGTASYQQLWQTMATMADNHQS